MCTFLKWNLKKMFLTQRSEECNKNHTYVLFKVMVIVVGNGHGDMSSNHGQG